MSNGSAGSLPIGQVLNAEHIDVSAGHLGRSLWQYVSHIRMGHR
jgi:hypothetical protein